jgi:hypothetical protein
MFEMLKHLGLREWIGVLISVGLIVFQVLLSFAI